LNQRSGSNEGKLALRAVMASAIALIALAFWVRGIEPKLPSRPVPSVEQGLAEPLQLLQRGGKLRLPELERVISAERRAQWDEQAKHVLELTGCPDLDEWLDSAEGQGVERFIAELRNGTSEEALAGLVLIFQLARSTHWSPGMFGSSLNAQRLGGLLEDWLRALSDLAARDPLLYEPSLAAALLCGRALRVAYRAQTFGRDEAAYQRAKLLFEALTGVGTSRRTAFGEALQARYPRAYQTLSTRSDFLLGCEEELRALFPDVDGKCSDR
jgi:hypothetical protein